MRLKNIQQRVETIEHTLTDVRFERSFTAANFEGHELPKLICRLQELEQEAWGILRRAVGRRDCRTALAVIPEICRIIELIAKLDGELGQQPTTNVLNVNIDPDTAKQVFEIYTKRHSSQIEEAK